MNSENTVMLLERYHREAKSIASHRYVVAASATCMLPFAIVAALCLTGQVPRIPWQAYCSIGAVTASILLPLWKAHFVSARSAEACLQKLHEQVCRSEITARRKAK